MNNRIDGADADVAASLGSPERLMALAAQGQLSKFTLASLLEEESRQQFLNACEALERHFTEACTAKAEPCLEDGCAMDGEICLQALLRAGTAFQKACSEAWLPLFMIESNRSDAWKH